MTLSPGIKLGPYEILAPIGAGGMGEVYKARDTRLDRIVAIKVLPANIADRPELRQRFEREARAVSSLNHPHICTLHDIGQQDGIDYLVMEYLEGETLAARLTKGPLPLDQTLRYSIEIAEALAQAHKQGVFHRDLKPGNIMLTKAGAKLLDFGLAKLRQSAAASSLSQIPTELDNLTQKGTILGTFQYMPPEQLEGKETDARGDIFAFGAVLYEMVTGRKAFQGSSQASLIAAIMQTQPAPVSALQLMTPPALDHVVEKCLAKDPDDRWQSAADLASQLKWISQPGSVSAAPVTPLPGQSAAMGAVSAAAIPAPSAPRRGLLLALSAVAAVLLVSTLALALIHFRELPADLHPVRFSVYPPPRATFGPFDMPVISPNGQRLVFTGLGADGKRILWLRSLDSLVVQPLAGAEGAYFPFWSPDSRYVAFHSSSDQKLKKIDVSGGPPQTICDTMVGAGGAWNRDGVILFRPKPGPLYRVSAAGGEAQPLLELDRSRKETGHSWPAFLPDGRHFLYLAQSADPGQTGIYLGSLDSKETRLVVRAASNVSYAPPGFLLFGRQETLLAQPFDLKKLQATGEPFPIAEQVGRTGGVSLSHFFVSENGALVYRGAGSSDLQLAWYNRDGKRLQPIGERGAYRQIALSPDEKRLAIERLDSKGGVDIWLLELSSGILSRVTFHPATDTDPVWSPDGHEIVFQSNRSGRPALYRKVIGGGDEELLFESSESKYAEQWLKDGSIVFITPNGKAFYRLPGPGGRPRRAKAGAVATDGVRQGRAPRLAGRALGCLQLQRVRPVGGLRGRLPVLH